VKVLFTLDIMASNGVFGYDREIEMAHPPQLDHCYELTPGWSAEKPRNVFYRAHNGTYGVTFTHSTSERIEQVQVDPFWLEATK